MLSRSIPGRTLSHPHRPGRLDRLDESIPADATAIAIVTNPTVAALYAERAEAALARTGRKVLRIELPDGEAHKDWQTLNRIFDALLEHRLDRRAVLVALGGGVIGDRPALPPRSICAASVSSRCPPRCCPRSIPRWAARPRSTIRWARI